MTKEKDFYWTITKDEFIERLKILKDPYNLAIWNYLQAYIIRGSAETALWKACYGLYKVNGLLASSISINKMSRDLNISRPKVIGVLNELDKNDYIIKYSSSNEGRNNTNIYILGITNTSTLEDGNIIIAEKYFVGRTKEMKNDVRNEIIQIYDNQIKTAETIDKITERLAIIQKALFNVDGK